MSGHFLLLVMMKTPLAPALVQVPDSLAQATLIIFYQPISRIVSRDWCKHFDYDESCFDSDTGSLTASSGKQRGDTLQHAQLSLEL